MITESGRPCGTGVQSHDDTAQPPVPLNSRTTFTLVRSMAVWGAFSWQSPVCVHVRRAGETCGRPSDALITVPAAPLPVVRYDELDISSSSLIVAVEQGAGVLSRDALVTHQN